MRGSNHSYLGMLVCENSRPFSLLARVANATRAGSEKGRLFSQAIFMPSARIFGRCIWKTGTQFLSWSWPAPRGDGTQSRNQSNEPRPGDSLLFKSDLMPLLSPTLPRDPRHAKGLGFNWLVHNKSQEFLFVNNSMRLITSDDYFRTNWVHLCIEFWFSFHEWGSLREFYIFHSVN